MIIDLFDTDLNNYLDIRLKTSVMLLSTTEMLADMYLNICVKISF